MEAWSINAFVVWQRIWSQYHLTVVSKSCSMLDGKRHPHPHNTPVTRKTTKFCKINGSTDTCTVHFLKVL
jgi:hypothetical protein